MDCLNIFKTYTPICPIGLSLKLSYKVEKVYKSSKLTNFKGEFQIK